MSNNKLAISLIIISVFFGTVMLSFLKIAQEDVNVYVAGFFRFFLGLVIILPYIIKKKDAVLKTTHLKQHFLRAILGLPAMLLYFSALVLLPIEKLTAISFVVPLIVTILAVFFLGEKIYIYRTLALLLGFSGMLVIIRPGFVDISIGVYMVLFSALLWSINIIITKKISKDDSAITILAYQSIFMSLLSFFIVLFFWEMPSLKTFIYLILAAMCGTVLHLTLNHAFKLVDVSMTQPYSFLNLVFASIIGYFVFDEIPDLYTWIGALIIFTGVLIISYREMKLDKEIIRKRVDIKS
ncbi:DMT family transporter [Candidatus Pelagibacter sp.]|jgi:drug/metabolite transporter (DMT)-like permease|nr:DMT family transporter [Candidatus Pelagibacter sp.]MDA8783915.1 DMT family transporter [Candidatus Pelagibacter bacterium]MDA7823921.1 DMT family transporter [Candidatus Pelagibacter sp.]MDA8809234.1 DMT family transporter [Candidatus Pelagibacter bacterium]MDA9187295.1 DMT family transporter [Candidatus Pelagibacter sp.]